MLHDLTFVTVEQISCLMVALFPESLAKMKAGMFDPRKPLPALEMGTPAFEHSYCNDFRTARGALVKKAPALLFCRPVQQHPAIPDLSGPPVL